MRGLGSWGKGWSQGGELCVFVGSGQVYPNSLDSPVTLTVRMWVWSQLVSAPSRPGAQGVDIPTNILRALIVCLPVLDAGDVVPGIIQLTVYLGESP